MDTSSHTLTLANLDDRSYRAQLYRPALPQDRAALQRLRHDTAALTVHDTLHAQLVDLVKTRHPARRLSRIELEELVAAELAGVAEADYGVWALYPWSQRLVHILDECEFVQLRTNRNCYKIAPAEQAVLATKRIGVVGLSVGQSVALVLALERSFGELRVADFDTLDLSNLNRLRSGVHNLGVPKVLVTAREIAEIDPYLTVVCFADGITTENLESFLHNGGPLDVLVEECDSIDLKVEIRHAARRHRIPVVMDTSDRGLLDIERFDLEPERPIFHGAVGDLDAARLRGLTTEQKVPYVLKIIGSESISTRLRASLLEVEQSIATWPQLASSVAMGGAVAADVVRRILLHQHRVSGRYFVDLDEIVPGGTLPTRDAGAPVEAASAVHADPPRLPGAGVMDIGPERIRALVSVATLAPSGGNAQPWKWRWRDRRLSLCLDAARSRSLLDFQSLAAVAALGAATENLVLAAHADALGVRVHAFPLGLNSTLVATFEFCERGEIGDEPTTADALAAWMAVRVTNRRIVERRPLDSAIYDALTEAVRQISNADVVWLRADTELDRVGRILGEADRLLFLDQRLHDEMMSEIRFDSPGLNGSRRGIPIETLELSPTDRAGLEISRSWAALSLVKEWGGGRNLEKMARKTIAASSAVGMVTMAGLTRADYFRGGRAVQRLWLKATELGLALQPMTALSYLFARMHREARQDLDDRTLSALEALWPAWATLFELSGTEAEVLVFRLGLADPPSARSPRCSIDDILEIA